MIVLTPQEKRTLLFLLILALAGVGIDYLSKQSPAVKAVACVHENLGKININTADPELLKEIPGVGDKLARRIIEYRSAHGAFSCVEELKSLKGFHNATFEKAKAVIFAE